VSQHFAEPTILYVDDQPSHLALFKKAFCGDYLILTAASGEEGLEILKNHEVFLVIADHNMPRMTGIDFLQKARDVSPKTVQAILSAYLNDEIVKEAAQKAKVAGHLTKPWKLDRMRNFIKESYRRYEIGIPAEAPQPKVDPLERGRISRAHLPRFVEQLGEKMDLHGARRIFLRYVEPSLKEYVPMIRRPIPELLYMAQREAIKGNVEDFQKILTHYFKQDCAVAASKTEADSPKATIN
jgi:CheY-like chemotaxis protein